METHLLYNNGKRFLVLNDNGYTVCVPISKQTYSELLETFDLAEEG